MKSKDVINGLDDLYGSAKCKSVDEKVNIVTDIIISKAKKSVGAVEHGKHRKKN